jgi:hypothetical protein
MTKLHAFLITLAVAFAVVAGAFAAFRTTQLGAASRSGVSPVVLASQTEALDRTQASLDRSLKSRPPKLPKVPKVKPVPVPEVQVPAPRVVTVRVPRPAAPSMSTGEESRSAGRQGSAEQATTPGLLATTRTVTSTTRTHEAETRTETRPDAETEHEGSHTTTGATTTTTTTTTESHDGGLGSDD